MNNKYIDRGLNSIFRLNTFVSLKSPKSIIDFEFAIFKSIINNLTPYEFVYLISQWPDFNKHKKIKQEIDDALLLNSIDNDLYSKVN